MPRLLFSYECRTCSQEFEELVDRDNPGTVNCLKCGSTNTHRLVTGGRIDPKLGVDAESWPTMGDRWARIRRQRKQIEDKQARDNGP